MKPCCVCVLVGAAVGMIAACYLLETNKKFKQLVKDGKSTVEKKVQKKKKNMES